MAERIRMRKSEAGENVVADAQPVASQPRLPKYKQSLQENLITLLAHHDKGGRAALGRVDTALFEGDYRIVAERIADYWRKYDKPPGDHTPDLFAEIIEDKHNRKAATYKRILSNMLVLSAGINADYIIDEIETFVRLQTTKIIILKAAEQINARQENALDDVNHILRDLVDGVTDRTAARLIPASEFEDRTVSWYWQPFFPRGVLTVLSALKGHGKTTVLIDIAADLSTHKKPRSTIVLVKEDSPSTLKGLMEAAGGDTSKLLFFAREDATGEKRHDPPDRLTPTELARLDQMVAERGDVGLIAIEPLNSFVDVTKANQDAGIRELLDRLSFLADRHRLMIVASAHWNKNRELPIRDRIIGSVGIVNTARSINVIVRDPEDQRRYVLVNLIGNFADPSDDNAIGFVIVTARGLRKVQWDDEDEMFRLDEDEVRAMVMVRGGAGLLGRPRKVDAATNLLKEWLAEGPLAASAVKERSEGAEIGWRTVEVAKKALDVRVIKKGQTWWWSLPQK